MIFAPHGLIGRFLHRRSVARWKAAAANVAQTPRSDLDAQVQMAQRLTHHVQNFSAQARQRLDMPRIGANAFHRPAGTDWSWRPKPWSIPCPGKGLAPALPKDSLTNELVVFHDCKSREISLVQVPNTRATDLAPFGIALEAFHFDGSYLSLVVEVPNTVCDGLRKSHLIRLAAVITCEQPTRVYARLNVKHGPNTEQLLLTFPDEADDTMVEFDLAYTPLNEARAERMWIDLMIEKPAMNKITFRDLTLSRYPRAEI